MRKIRTMAPQGPMDKIDAPVTVTKRKIIDRHGLIDIDDNLPRAQRKQDHAHP